MYIPKFLETTLNNHGVDSNVGDFNDNHQPDASVGNKANPPIPPPLPLMGPATSTMTNRVTSMDLSILLKSQETIGSMGAELLDLLRSTSSGSMSGGCVTATKPKNHHVVRCDYDDFDNEEDEEQGLSPPPPIPCPSWPTARSLSAMSTSFALDFIELMRSTSTSQAQLQQPQQNTDWNKDENGDVESSVATTTTTTTTVPGVAEPPAQEEQQRQGRKRKSYEPPANARSYLSSSYTDLDVLCQRGGLANQHPGNHRYLKAKEEWQVVYRDAPKHQRTAVAQQLVDHVTGWGGRFVRYDRNKQAWYEIHNHTARTKAGQALREDYSAQERKEKRERFRLQRQNQKKKNLQKKNNKNKKTAALKATNEVQLHQEFSFSSSSPHSCSLVSSSESSSSFSMAYNHVAV